MIYRDVSRSRLLFGGTGYRGDIRRQERVFSMTPIFPPTLIEERRSNDTMQKEINECVMESVEELRR